MGKEDKDTYSDEPRSKFAEFIPGKLYDIPVQAEIGEDVRIVSEIASRLLELREVDPRKPIRLLLQLSKVYRISSTCLWMVCEILASNRKGGKSLSEIGKETGISKQAIHQRQKRDLLKLKEIMPEIAEVVSIILGRTVGNSKDV